jgi:hypothetical protein
MSCVLYLNKDFDYMTVKFIYFSVVNSVSSMSKSIKIIEINLLIYVCICTAGIAQSVYRLATGWTTERSEFESRWGQEFSLLRVVQTGSGVYSTSYPMCTGGSFPGGKAAGT